MRPSEKKKIKPLLSQPEDDHGDINYIPLQEEKPKSWQLQLKETIANLFLIFVMIPSIVGIALLLTFLLKDIPYFNTHEAQTVLFAVSMVTGLICWSPVVIEFYPTE